MGRWAVSQKPKLIQIIRYSVNIAKVDTDERGGGGDGLAKDIHHKRDRQEVISVGFSFNFPPPPPPTPILPGPFGTAATQVRR